MKTSYFAGYKDLNGISIAIKAPAWYTGTCYPALYPKWSFLSQYKKDGDMDAYMISYHKQILAPLDPEKVYNDLKDTTLLCWEKPRVFCHRRIVAKWLEYNLDIVVPEI